MERLGLGPEICMERNPRLVYGRMTGWGQSGPLARVAAHDNNYLALSGALWYAGNAGDPPVAPPTMLGDLGGGALYLAVGLLAGILSARAGGKGTVVDAAIVDGSAHLMNILLAFKATGQFSLERGKSLLDGPHWFATYRCADGNFITVGALEPQFRAGAPAEARARTAIPHSPTATTPAAGPLSSSGSRRSSRRARAPSGASCSRAPTRASRRC
jgi:acetyl-CoA hydrolase